LDEGQGVDLDENGDAILGWTKTFGFGCPCQPAPNHYVTEDGTIQACDTDGDGWMNFDAYARIFVSDPNNPKRPSSDEEETAWNTGNLGANVNQSIVAKAFVYRNYRCQMRDVSSFTLVPEQGRTSDEPDAFMGKLMSDAIIVPTSHLGGPGEGGALEGPGSLPLWEKTEQDNDRGNNPLTKVCADQVDANGNSAMDWAEDQRTPGSQQEPSTAIWDRMAYFTELHRGGFRHVAKATGAGRLPKGMIHVTGTYRIEELSRTATDANQVGIGFGMRSLRSDANTVDDLTPVNDPNGCDSCDGSNDICHNGICKATQCPNSDNDCDSFSGANDGKCIVGVCYTASAANGDPADVANYGCASRKVRKAGCTGDGPECFVYLADDRKCARDMVCVAEADLASPGGTCVEAWRACSVQKDHGVGPFKSGFPSANGVPPSHGRDFQRFPYDLDAEVESFYQRNHTAGMTHHSLFKCLAVKPSNTNMSASLKACELYRGNNPNCDVDEVGLADPNTGEIPLHPQNGDLRYSVQKCTRQVDVSVIVDPCSGAQCPGQFANGANPLNYKTVCEQVTLNHAMATVGSGGLRADNSPWVGWGVVKFHNTDGNSDAKDASWGCIDESSNSDGTANYAKRFLRQCSPLACQGAEDEAACIAAKNVKYNAAECPAECVRFDNDPDLVDEFNACTQACYERNCIEQQQPFICRGLTTTDFRNYQATWDPEGTVASERYDSPLVGQGDPLRFGRLGCGCGARYSGFDNAGNLDCSFGCPYGPLTSEDPFLIENRRGYWMCSTVIGSDGAPLESVGADGEPDGVYKLTGSVPLSAVDRSEAVGSAGCDDGDPATPCYELQ
jgi:hypothetical protein